MVEQVSENAVPLWPVHARTVAGELREAFDRASLWQDPPIDIHEVPPALNATARASATLDAVFADRVLAKALKACL